MGVVDVVRHDQYWPGASADDHDRSSTEVLLEVFVRDYPSLVRLAALLLDDPHLAEDVVQDAYLRVATRHYRLNDHGKALAYLRRTVLNLARNSMRRRRLARRHGVVSLAAVSSAEEEAITAFERQQIVSGLQRLPRRQREVLVLRYFLDCSIEATAQVLGITTGSVKAYGSRGIQQLKDML